MRDNKYTAFFTYLSSLIFIIALNYLFRWAVVKIQGGMTGATFLLYLIPILEGALIGMTAVTIFKLQVAFNNKYFIYISLLIFAGVILSPLKVSGFVMLHLGVSTFSALIASLRRDSIRNGANKNSKKRKKNKN